jgi:hypothetical protein
MGCTPGTAGTNVTSPRPDDAIPVRGKLSRGLPKPTSGMVIAKDNLRPSSGFNVGYGNISAGAPNLGQKIKKAVYDGGQTRQAHATTLQVFTQKVLLAETLSRPKGPGFSRGLLSI